MKAEWSNKDSIEMPTTTTSDYIKREDAKKLFLKYMGDDLPPSIKEQVVEKAFEELPSADVIEAGKQYPATEFNVEEELKDGKLYFAIVRNEGGNDETD